jgi:hypothetical protein
MASKSTPNWSQRVEEKVPPKIVYTRKNTTFEDWKKMTKHELELLGLRYEDEKPLNLLHGWEFDNTPKNYAFLAHQKIMKAASRAG